MLKENVLLAFAAIRANKMRSVLTMLGIIIGIGSVISIVSIGDSIRSAVAKEYESIGINRAYVYVSYYVEEFRMSDYYTIEDVQDVREYFKDDIAYVDGSPYQSSEAVYGRNKLKISFTGIDEGFEKAQETNVIYGRMLTSGDILGRKNNAVIEEGAAQRLFGSANAVGKSMRVELHGNMTDVNIVGVYREDISPFRKAIMKIASEESNSAYVPGTLLQYPNDIFFSLNIYIADGVDLEDFKQRMIAYEARVKNREEGEIYYNAAADEMSDMDSIMSGLSIAVGAIAAISLLVGGIGIMNIMLVSVTERTREIGIRKALGARTKDIMLQFLTESAIISACGGILGILFGVGIVSLGALVVSLSVVVRPIVVVMAVVFSAMVGIFFGIYPASKAAKSDPIESLRYE